MTVDYGLRRLRSTCPDFIMNQQEFSVPQMSHNDLPKGRSKATVALVVVSPVRVTMIVALPSPSPTVKPFSLTELVPLVWGAGSGVEPLTVHVNSFF